MRIGHIRVAILSGAEGPAVAFRLKTHIAGTSSFGAVDYDRNSMTAGERKLLYC
jgi:hypothetical protein